MSSDSLGAGPGRRCASSFAGLKVLVVDDDALCLKVVEQMLKRCQYNVTTSTSGRHALSLLRQDSSKFDLVLSDVYMPDMDGFKLLETVGLELEIPVVMMSSNGDTTLVLRGVTHGAVDFLIKPVRIEELRNVWQHVIRRQRSVDPEQEAHGPPSDTPDSRADPSWEAPTSEPRKRKETTAAAKGEQRDRDDNPPNKKARVVWSVAMHQQFVNAVEQLGIDKAVPKKILELMKQEGLTRENVASHLQKYRLYLRRVEGVSTTQKQRAGSGAAATPATAAVTATATVQAVPHSTATAAAAAPSPVPPRSNMEFQPGAMLPAAIPTGIPYMPPSMPNVPGGYPSMSMPVSAGGVPMYPGGMMMPPMAGMMGGVLSPPGTAPMDGRGVPGGLPGGAHAMPMHHHMHMEPPRYLPSMHEADGAGGAGMAGGMPMGGGLPMGGVPLGHLPPMSVPPAIAAMQVRQGGGVAPTQPAHDARVKPDPDAKDPMEGGSGADNRAGDPRWPPASPAVEEEGGVLLSSLMDMSDLDPGLGFGDNLDELGGGFGLDMPPRKDETDLDLLNYFFDGNTGSNGGGGGNPAASTGLPDGG